MKLQKIFYPIVNTAIRILLVLIVAGLFLQSLFSTSFVGVVISEEGSLQERTLNIADDPWRHFIVFAVVTVIGVLVCKCCGRWKARTPGGLARAGIPAVQHPVSGSGTDSIQTDAGHTANDGQRMAWNRMQADDMASGAPGQYKSAGRHMIRMLTVLVLLMGTFWILVTQLRPGSDPAKVYAIAMQWRKGNFSAYAEGGYLFRYPYQAGIILFYYLLSFVFGVDNYTGLQMVNVAALALTYLLLVKLASFFWKEDEKLPVIVYGALILWLPLAFYVTYLYGILPGMALSLGAVYYVARYLDTGKYRYILPACVCMGLATVIKMNCVIYLIAIGCFLIYDAAAIALSAGRKSGNSVFGGKGDQGEGVYGAGTESAGAASLSLPGGSRRGIVSLAIIGLMGLSVIGCNEAVNRYVEHLSGYEAGEGQVMLSWVVMGLQETPLGPGGYSGYIGDIYVKYDYDTEKVTEASWTDIKKVMKRMAANPLDEGVAFFARKNAFQWNDPTFICLDRTKGRGSAIELPEFASSLIEGRGSVVFYVVMNYMQTLLLLGMLLYLFMNWKSRNLYELMGAVVFLGGYLFHFIWESSASYTIPYFVVMIPYGAKGLADWVRYVDMLPGYMADNRGGSMEKKDLVRRIGAPVGGIVAAAVLVVLLSRTNLFYKTIALNDGEEARAQFYHESDEKTGEIQDGYYYFTPVTVQGMTLAEKNGNVTLVSLNETQSDAGSIDPEDAGSRNDTGNAGGTVYVPDVRNIEQKILLQKEAAGGNVFSGVSLRFRSNEQVLAVKKDGDESRLTVYMDDGMNMFYEPDGHISCLWSVYGTPEDGYYIVMDNMALTCRDGEVVLEELTESEEQRWLLE